MARPKLPPEQRTTATVGVRLTAADRSLLDRLVELVEVDRQAQGAPGPTTASDLLRELLHREGRARGVLPPNPDGTVPPRGEARATPRGPLPPYSSPPSPLAGLLPPGALVVLWPAGYPLPIPGAPSPGAAPWSLQPSASPPGGTPAPSPPPPPASAAPPTANPPLAPVPVAPAPLAYQPVASVPVAPVPVAPVPVASVPVAPVAPAPPSPLSDTDLRSRLESVLETTPGLRAMDVAQGAGLSSPDISTFRHGKRLPAEKRAKLAAWLEGRS